MKGDVKAGDEARALAAVDADRIAADLSALVRAPSVTGRERPGVDAVAELAAGAGLAPVVREHDLAGLRAAAGYPGEEAERADLFGATVTLPGAGTRRLALNAHVDVVAPGVGWGVDPFGGLARDGFVYGCGAADMKGGVVAAVHAMAAIHAAGVSPPAEVVLEVVASEEDGGLGTFAALQRDDRFDACLIPEPTGFAVVCAHAGALTFLGTVRGRSAHAALRLQGVSAVDRYVSVHRALARHERSLNTGVTHPLMRGLELPYPVVVGRVEAGRWSSQVPDELRFEGRLGVRVGETADEARSALEAVVATAADGAGPPVEIRWTGGQFAPAEIAVDHAFVECVRGAVAAELGARPPAAGVPYGADMRLYSERGIPCVMFGTPGVERAHGPDERVGIADVVRLARALVRVMLRFGAERQSADAGDGAGRL